MTQESEEVHNVPYGHCVYYIGFHRPTQVVQQTNNDTIELSTTGELTFQKNKTGNLR